MTQLFLEEIILLASRRVQSAPRLPTTNMSHRKKVLLKVVILGDSG